MGSCGIDRRRGRASLVRARRLRRDATLVERMLWEELRGRRIGGAKFRRQVPIGPYIVDFVCFEHRLVVELDGEHHGGTGKAIDDAKRMSWLEGEGYRVLRFWNDEVVDGMEGVLEMIGRELGRGG